jgi:hypothetical protein
MKKNSFSFVAAIITCALVGGVATSTGCGGNEVASLCEDICACQRCTSNDLQACRDAGDQALDQADSAGCSSQFDDVVACSSAHVSCDGSRAVFEGCDAEVSALTKCSSGLGAFGKNPCERATDRVRLRIKSCGGMMSTTSTSSGSAMECTAATEITLACQATCIDVAECSLIVPDSNKPPTDAQTQAFINCLKAC